MINFHNFSPSPKQLDYKDRVIFNYLCCNLYPNPSACHNTNKRQVLNNFSIILFSWILQKLYVTLEILAHVLGFLLLVQGKKKIYIEAIHLEKIDGKIYCTFNERSVYKTMLRTWQQDIKVTICKESGWSV